MLLDLLGVPFRLTQKNDDGTETVTMVEGKDICSDGDFEKGGWYGYRVVREYVMYGDKLRKEYDSIFEIGEGNKSDYEIDPDAEYNVYELNETQRLADPYPMSRCAISKIKANN